MPVEPLQAADPGVRRIAAAVEASLDTLVAAATESIWAEVPAYAGQPR